MRIAKAVTLIIALTLGGMALQLVSPEKARARDKKAQTIADLPGTEWSDTVTTITFKKGGAAEVQITDDDPIYQGRYVLKATSVEITFGNGNRATATLIDNGKYLQVKVAYASGKKVDFALAQFIDGKLND